MKMLYLLKIIGVHIKTIGAILTSWGIYLFYNFSVQDLKNGAELVEILFKPAVLFVNMIFTCIGIYKILNKKDK